MDFTQNLCLKDEITKGHGKVKRKGVPRNRTHVTVFVR